MVTNIQASAAVENLTIVIIGALCIFIIIHSRMMNCIRRKVNNKITVHNLLQINYTKYVEFIAFAKTSKNQFVHTYSIVSPLGHDLLKVPMTVSKPWPSG